MDPIIISYLGLILVAVIAGIIIFLIKIPKLNNFEDNFPWEKLEQIFKLALVDTNEKISGNQIIINGLPDIIIPKVENVVSKNNEHLINGFGLLKETIKEAIADNRAGINKDINELKEKILKSQEEFKEELKKALKGDFDSLINKVEDKLYKIENKVKESLDEGFKKSTKTFQDVLERLTKIDEAQKQIRELSSNVVSLQDILTDKKTRGIFGEVQLGHILKTIFGDTNDQIYKEQYKLSNSAIADCILFLPDPIGKLCIDSKFPLENYERMFSPTLSDSEKDSAKKQFKINVKKHIDDISSKYILAGETCNQALMFLPAEAIFAEINAYHRDILDYATKKRVWVTSPTTIMSFLTIIQVSTTELKRSKYMGIIHEHLNKLGEDFQRYRNRWEALDKQITTVSNTVKDINTSTNKITKRFDQIKNVNVESISENSVEDLSLEYNSD
jgi:DNA recombination protein RmuC